MSTRRGILNKEPVEYNIVILGANGVGKSGKKKEGGGASIYHKYHIHEALITMKTYWFNYPYFLTGLV